MHRMAAAAAVVVVVVAAAAAEAADSVGLAGSHIDVGTKWAADMDSCRRIRHPHC